MVLILYVQYNTAYIQLEMTTLKMLENEGLKMNFSHYYNPTFSQVEYIISCGTLFLNDFQLVTIYSKADC